MSHCLRRCAVASLLCSVLREIVRWWQRKVRALCDGGRVQVVDDEFRANDDGAYAGNDASGSE